MKPFRGLTFPRDFSTFEHNARLTCAFFSSGGPVRIDDLAEEQATVAGTTCHFSGPGVFVLMPSAEVDVERLLVVVLAADLVRLGEIRGFPVVRAVQVEIGVNELSFGVDGLFAKPVLDLHHSSQTGDAVIRPAGQLREYPDADQYSGVMPHPASMWTLSCH
jgi:hypothetical protein